MTKAIVALPRSRRRPLATCIASLFALSAPAAAIADSWVVNSCAEGSSGGPGNVGTLRYALQHATSPAFIDLSGLTGGSACANSKISLTTGELNTSLATVTLNGPGAANLQLDASAMLAPPPSYGDLRVINHSGTGKLTIQNLGITGGHVTHFNSYRSSGGCISSVGDVELDDVNVSSCYVSTLGTNYSARGGGVYTQGALTLNGSSVTGSHAIATGSTYALGGGVYAAGGVILSDYSSIGGNYAQANAKAAGGSLFSKGDVTLTKASVYSSHATSIYAYAVGGGVYTQGNLTIAGAAIASNATDAPFSRAIGGGVYVKGNAGVSHCSIKYNTATSEASRALGGGAYVRGNFTLTSSNVYKNSVASSNFLSSARGGGAMALGNFFTSYSTIRDNTAHGPGLGGGLNLSGNVVTIATSTISGNVSESGYGGVDVYTGAAPGSTLAIESSTISGNVGVQGVGGLYADSATAKFYNSTIAFNTSTGAASSPGVRLRAQSPSTAVTLQSTLLSNNTYGTFESDLDAVGANPLVFNGGNLATPANNLIRVTAISPLVLPADTKQGFCPHLDKLRDNGGLTKTHALQSHSVAIDTGNINFGGLFYDQRGPAIANGTIDYPRISGPTGNPNPKPDIGAYEVQQQDVIFDTDFEDCVPPPV